jgi:ankyrin repeat protein
MTRWIRFVAILLQFFLFTTSNATQPSQQEIESLVNAISTSDSAAVLELLKHNINLCNSVVWGSRRPLHVATAKGWDDVVDFLLKNGADPNAEGDSWDTSNYRSTSLEVAVKYNHLSIFKRLLDAHANPNHVGWPDGSAMQIAFAYHRDEMASLLLEYGANPFLEGNAYRKRTPFEMAITQCAGKLVPEMLKSARVKKEAKANFLTEHGSALLAAAVQRGELEAVEALLAANVKPTENPQGLTLLQTLSRSFAEAKKSKGFDTERWTKIHELLQKNGCSDDAFSTTGFGDLGAARNFFKTNPNVAQAKDNEGQSLLHWSVLTDQLPLTDFWLQSGASPVVTNSAGQTPLHLAAARGLTNQLMRLLAANPPLDVKDTDGLTAFDVAVQAKQTEAVRLLLPRSSQNTSAKYGISTPLHKAAADGNIDSFTNALQTTTNLEAHDELGFTPFQIAVKRGHLLAATLLLEAGANVNARDAKGNTALHLIMLEPPSGISDEPPISWYARIRQDPQMMNLFGYLLLGGNSSQQSAVFDAAVFLLANKAVTSLTNDAGQSVVQLAMTNSVFIFEYERPVLLNLLSSRSAVAGNNGVNQRDSNGDTALHRAARDIYADKVDELIAGGAEVNATNNLGRTPLHAVVENLSGWPGPLTELLKAGADANAQDNEGMTPLHVLATASEKMFRREATKALLEAGANPNIRDKHGRTTLLVFLSGKWPWDYAGECVSTLLEAGADPTIADDQGQTAFHYLAALGEERPMFFIRGIGDTLIAAKANVQARDNAGNTPLHIAAKAGTKDVYDWLIQHGASLDATNYAGQTPRQLMLNSTN